MAYSRPLSEGKIEEELQDWLINASEEEQEMVKHMTDYHRMSEVQTKAEIKLKEDLDWLISASEEQQELKQLKDYLVNLDKVHRVNPDSERSKIILQGVREIVETIGRGITECKAQLRGQIIPMGSAHNGTKIGDLDEFDFVYEIELDTLLKGKGSFKRLNPGGAIVHIDDRSGIEFIKSVRNTIANTSDKDMALQFIHMKDTFCEILVEVLSKLKLPSGWGHGGFNRPHFSGIRLQGKSCLLQFDYLGTGAETPLCISIDFVPMIKLKSVESRDPLKTLEKFIIRKMKAQYTWLSLDESKTYFGYAEEQWFFNYPNESTPKKLIRICKVLTKLTKMNSPSLPDEKFQQAVNNHLKAKQHDGSIKLSKYLSSYGIMFQYGKFVHKENDVITGSDLNETIGDVCMVKSYTIKKIVLTMMSTDPSEGREWTDDDLPDLVIALYRLLLYALGDDYIGETFTRFPEVETEFMAYIKEENELSDKTQTLTLQRETNPFLGESSLTHSSEIQTSTLQRDSREVSPQSVPNTNPPLGESSLSHSSETQTSRLQRDSREVSPQSVPNTIETNPPLGESSLTHSSEIQTSTLQRDSQEVFPRSVPNTNPPLGESSLTHGSENLPGELVKTNFYKTTKESLDKMRGEVIELQPIVMSRISGIFQILRAVCEGKDSVTVAVLDCDRTGP